MQELAFLKIRIAQALRELKVLGFLYAVILLAGILVLLFWFYKTQVSTLNCSYAVIGLSFAIVLFHMSRQDHNFVNSIANRSQVVFFTEYVFAIMPFVVLSILKSNSPVILTIVFPLILISTIKKPIKSFSSTGVLGKYIPGELYEWKAGLRKTGWIFVVLWVASILLSPIPFASLIILWFLLLIVSSFYETGESREMIESFKLDQKKLVLHKMLFHACFFMILAAPALLLSIILFPDKWWVIILFSVFSCINMMVFVVSKYAVWRHGENNNSVTLLNGICMAGFFLPFLLPLPLFILARNYKKAIVNLHPILNDYH